MTAIQRIIIFLIAALLGVALVVPAFADTQGPGVGAIGPQVVIGGGGNTGTPVPGGIGTGTGTATPVPGGWRP